MTSNELHAWRGDTHVAVFVDTSDGVSLHYDSDTASRLSLSFPTTGEFSNKAPARWLDGLLPERDRDREAFARKHDCSTEPFDLLQHVGADVGGAISLLRTDESPTDSATTAVTVTDETIALMIAQQSRDLPPSSPGFGGIRMSFAGYQAKFSLARSADGRQPPPTRLFHPLTSSSRHWSTTRTFIASRLPPWNWPTVADYPQLAPG
nr:HipA N-terminal domain-containing protein [Pseudoclavibacter sp. Marseille-Q3772]